MTKKILVAVDVQNDFVDGELGSGDAINAVPKIVARISAFDGTVYATADTHYSEDYLNTHEGKYLPILHTIAGTHGWKIQEDVMKAICSKERYDTISKSSFGSQALYDYILRHAEYKGANLEITLMGFCTDICVISNALMLRSLLPEAEIFVDAECCAGTTQKAHREALNVMRSCHIQIINDDGRGK